MVYEQNTAAEQLTPVIARSTATKQSKSSSQDTGLPRSLHSLAMTQGDNFINDRLEKIKIYTNEIGKNRLLENKKSRQAQWTPEKRKAQAEKIKRLKP